MKKYIFIIILCVVGITISCVQTQTEKGMLDLDEYLISLGIEENSIFFMSSIDFEWRKKFNGKYSQEEANFFGSLTKQENILDSKLEYALISYYSNDIANSRPFEANVILPIEDQKLADLRLASRVYMEMVVLSTDSQLNRTLVPKYNNMISYICNRGNISLDDILLFCKNNIEEYIDHIINSIYIINEMNKDDIKVLNDTKKVLVRFYLNPNRNTFNSIVNIYFANDNSKIIFFLLEYIDKELHALVAFSGMGF